MFLLVFGLSLIATISYAYLAWAMKHPVLYGVAFTRFIIAAVYAAIIYWEWQGWPLLGEVFRPWFRSGLILILLTDILSGVFMCLAYRQRRMMEK